MNIKKKIEEYEITLQEKGKSITSYYNLIKLKAKYTNENIYPLVKDYFNFYLQSIDLENYGYDQVNNAKLISITKFLDLKEQKSILQYLDTKIKLHKPELGNNWIIDEIHRIDRRIYLQNVNLINIIKLVLNLSSSNLYALTFSVIALVCLFSMILIPAPFEFMGIYGIKSEIFSVRNFFERFIISAIIIFDLNEDVKIISLNSCAVILKIFGSLIFYTVFVNFIFKYFNDYLKRL